MKQFVIAIILLIGLSISTEAAWSCIPDYQLDDPYQYCLETSVDEVNGNYQGLPNIINFTHAEKQALLFKLEIIFNQIF